MRVTERMIFQNAARDTAKAREALEKARELTSTGLKVSHPSDDSAAAGLIVSHGMSRDRLSALSKGAAAAAEELVAADNALGDVSSSLSRIRQLAVQFSSSGYPQSQSSMGAKEVGALYDQIVADLNIRFGNRYLFGGYQDDAPPFDNSTATYLGDAGVRTVEIAPGVTEQANVRADVAIMGSGGGTNVLQTIRDLVTALEANDLTAIQNTLDGLDASINQVSTARSQAGASMNIFDTAVAASQLVADVDTNRIASLSDTDLIESSIQLASAQTALQAALAASAQSFSLSLLNYL